jgi:hypothetical protein
MTKTLSKSKRSKRSDQHAKMQKPNLPTASESNIASSSSIDRPFERRRNKVVLYVASYIIAVIALLLIMPEGSQQSSGRTGLQIVFSPYFLIALGYFPMGLFSFFLQRTAGDLSPGQMSNYIGGGWLFYILYLLIATNLSSIRTAKVLYVVFVLLLVLNIRGCLYGLQ